MRSIVRASKRGFTLIELMIVVAIVGILAVLAIYGVRKYLANAKTAEARNNLGELSRDLGLAFEREQTSAAAGTALSEGSSITISHVLCAAPTGALPATVPLAQKILVSTVQWNVDQSATVPTGFACAKFVIDSPVYYQYNFATVQPTNGAGGSNTVTALGDLNGDTVQSTFTMINNVQAGKYTMAPGVTEVNPEE